ncbi:MAG: imelysin family protein [Pseudomonadales bacterium]|nr:imelysin family protein [Pseudomonadales bacterium]
MKQLTLMAVTSAAIATLFLGCSSDSDRDASIEDLQQQAVENAVNRMIIPAYELFENQLSELLTDTTNFCNEAAGSHTTGGLTILQTSWKSAMDTWSTLQVVRTGPVMEENRMLRIQLWPDPTNKVGIAAELIVASPSIISEAFIAGESVQSQGLPILEYLFFASNSGDPLVDLNGMDGARRCDLALAVSANLYTLATTLNQNWSDSFSEQLVNPGNGGVFATNQDAIDELVNGMVELLEITKNKKLTVPLGNGTPNQQAVESYRSHHSLTNIIKNLEGIRTLYRGGDGFGLDDFINDVADQSLIDIEMEDFIQQSISDAETISLPLTDAITDPAQSALAIALEQTLSDLTSFVKNDFAYSLDATIGFNANDGD